MSPRSKHTVAGSGRPATTTRFPWFEAFGSLFDHPAVQAGSQARTFLDREGGLAISMIPSRQSESTTVIRR
jgi:hypothetical protein